MLQTPRETRAQNLCRAHHAHFRRDFAFTGVFFSCPSLPAEPFTLASAARRRSARTNPARGPQHGRRHDNEDRTAPSAGTACSPTPLSNTHKAHRNSMHERNWKPAGAQCCTRRHNGATMTRERTSGFGHAVTQLKRAVRDQLFHQVAVCEVAWRSFLAVHARKGTPARWHLVQRAGE